MALNDQNESINFINQYINFFGLCFLCLINYCKCKMFHKWPFKKVYSMFKTTNKHVFLYGLLTLLSNKMHPYTSSEEIGII